MYSVQLKPKLPNKNLTLALTLTLTRALALTLALTLTLPTGGFMGPFADSEDYYQGGCNQCNHSQNQSWSCS